VEVKKGGEVLKNVPQRLKPPCAHEIYGTAKAVPFVERVFPWPAKPERFSII
jgi:hypothetical protein